MFWERKSQRVICSFKRMNPSFRSFGKEGREQFPFFTKSEKSDEEWFTLCCFGHKKDINVVKRTNLKEITLKKIESFFHKKQIAPVTIYFKNCTFAPVALFVKSDKSESLPPLCKEQQEQFTLVALFKRTTRAKERRAKEVKVNSQPW